MYEKPLYLVMVTSDENHNKYYRMIPNGDTFTVQYGRVGNDYVATDSYPIHMWDKKLNEKLKKGYLDQTRLVATTLVEKKDRQYSDISEKSIASIVARLQAFARKAIADNYTITSNKVTQTMIDEAQDLIDRLILTDYNQRKFNDILIELFRTIPRKMDKVVNYLAYEDRDYRTILQREQDLLDVMRGQVVQQELNIDETDTSTETKQTLLEALGLQIFETTKEDKDIIKNKLDNHLDIKFNNAWIIVNSKTQKSFDDFISKNNIKDKRLFWHGSRNENWWSIMQSGLVLRPNAVITGKMFGEGIYFAPSAQKSFGYTSHSGSYWARGDSPIAFMSLFDVAYGNPYHVYSHGDFYRFDYKRLQEVKPDANCLHAHAGQLLHNDEIVIYKENQITIKYLVELS
jgi:poly [ADP-ribose] polymerase 2/3/4